MAVETVISLIALAVLAAAWFGGKRYWERRIRSAREASPATQRLKLAQSREDAALAHDRAPSGSVRGDDETDSPSPWTLDDH
jgi:hypothetical protein